MSNFENHTTKELEEKFNDLYWELGPETDLFTRQFLMRIENELERRYLT